MLSTNYYDFFEGPGTGVLLATNNSFFGAVPDRERDPGIFATAR